MTRKISYTDNNTRKRPPGRLKQSLDLRHRARWFHGVPNPSCRFLLEKWGMGMEGLHTVSLDKNFRETTSTCTGTAVPAGTARLLGSHSEAQNVRQAPFGESFFNAFLAFLIHFPRPNYTKEVKNSDGSLKTVTTDKVEHLSCLSICCLASWPRTADQTWRDLIRLDRWPESSGSEFAFYLMAGF